MKSLVILIAVLVLTPSIAQNNCSQFYPREVGKTHVIHQLDKRERLSTIVEYTVTDVTSNGMSIAMNLKDKRNRPITSSSFNAICASGTTRLDPASVMVAQMQQYDGMEYEITGDDISIPNTISVGETLPDASVTMKVDAGMMNITTTVTMTNRRVASQESVTTPAGTFDCYLITYSNNLSMGALNKSYSSKQWIARGVGMVKEETRKANGNLMTKSILQSIN